MFFPNLAALLAKFHTKTLCLSSPKYIALIMYPNVPYNIRELKSPSIAAVVTYMLYDSVYNV